MGEASAQTATNPQSQRDDWDTHWRHYAPAAEINPAATMRAEAVLRLLQLPPGACRVIDIGSGQGDMAACILRDRPGANVIGLELSAAGVALARKKVPQARFFQTDLLDGSPAPPELWAFADYAVCSEVLEHVDEPIKLLSGALPYLAPGCRVVVTVPGGPMSAFDHHIGHRRHFDCGSLRALIEGAGLEVMDVHGAGFPWFNVYRLAVVARGKRLVAEVTSGETGVRSSLRARLAMRIFRMLFWLNLPRSSLGWQIVCVARVR